MTTKQLLASMNFIQYPRFLGYYLGVNETVLLSELCDKDSWCELNIVDYDGWFFAKREDILIDTGLSDKEQRAALQNLSNINLIKYERRGLPAKTYYNIDQNELEKVLDAAYSDYKERKIQMLPNSTSSDAPSVTSRGDETAIHTITKITKQEEIQESPEKDLQIKNPRRNFKEKFKPLEDKLQSGRDIDEQKAQKKMSTKEKLIFKCNKEVDSRNFDAETKQLLKEYFNWACDGNDVRRIKSKDLWVSKLNALEQIIKRTGDSGKEIVQQSIDNQWYMFNELQKNKPTNHKSAASIDNDWLIPQTLHGDEVLEEIERRKKAGMKVY